MTRRTVFRVVVAILVVAVATWWTLRSVDLGNMWSIMTQADPWLVLACVPVILLSHVVRAHRWVILLRPSAPTAPLGTATSAVLIGYAANAVVPRLGEVLRPWVFAKRTGIPLGTSLATVVVERLLDVLSLVLGIAIVSLAANDRITAAIPSFSMDRVVSVIVIPTLVLAVGLVVVAFTGAGEWVINRAIRPLRATLADTLIRLLATARTGLRAVAQPRLYAGLAIDSVGIWILWSIPMLLCYHAIDHAVTVPFGLVDATIMLLIVSLGATIAPTPGAVGVYQSFAQGALMVLYGAGTDEAMAFAMLTWLMNYMLVLLVGALALANELRHGIAWRDLVDSSRNA